MFDISKPKKPSGTANRAKLSRERAGGRQAWAKTSPAVSQDWPQLSPFTLPFVLG